MGKQDHISRLAKLFGIAPSALRYWDAEGLIRFARSPENQYRVPVAQTMMDISDVLLHRKCSLSIPEIRALPTMTTDEIQAVLAANEEKLTRQIESLMEARRRLRGKEEQLRTLEELRRHGLRAVRCRLPALRHFSYEDPELLARYMRDSSLGGLGIRPGRERPDYTLWLDERESGDYRPADPEERLYLHGVFRIEDDREERSDLPKFRAEAARLGRPAGWLLGRYLLTAQEKGVRCDFYEAWLELREISV